MVEPRQKPQEQADYEDDLREDTERQAEDLGLNLQDAPIEDLEGRIEGVEDAVAHMEAREKRRDTAYNTGGDDHSPGIDTDMDSNAPKELQFSPEKRGGKHGKNS